MTAPNTNSTDWLAGYRQALEDAAKIVEGHITVPVWSGREFEIKPMYGTWGEVRP